MTETPAGFWSYAHADDDAERGKIRGLASEVAAEYSLLTGEDLDIFVDRDGIKWGDEWTLRVDDAIRGTTFFMPIITPRFFKREECRRELQLFHSQAESLGVQEYLLPIYYAQVKDFSPDNPDEVVALVSRTQYFSWTDLRLVPADDAAYRRGVHLLAERLIEIAASLADSAKVAPSGNPSEDEPKMLDLLARIEALWPPLVEIIEQDRVLEGKYYALWNAHFDRLRRLAASGRRVASETALILHLAEEILPLTEQHLDLCRKYSAATIELDPLILALLRYADFDREIQPEVLDHFRADIADICRRIEEHARDGNATLTESAKVSQKMNRALLTFRESTQFASEGNRILLNWYQLAFGSPYPNASAIISYFEQQLNVGLL